jgi:hypothetical protein
MAGENESRTGKSGLHNWKQPKMEHSKFLLSMLQSPLPLIVCLRAKYKTRQAKGTQEMADAGMIQRNQIGKNVVLKDEFTSPIQAEDFVFEMTVHGEIMGDHSLRLTKCSHPALRECFPSGKPIAIEHGERLSRWCAAPSGAPVKAPANAPGKAALWAATKSVHGGDPAKLDAWLHEQGILSDGQALKDLDDESMRLVADEAKGRLSK